MALYYMHDSAQKEDFSVALQKIHNAMIAKMKTKTDKRNALELQTILQQIKRTARDLDSMDDSVVKAAMQSEFYELIEGAANIQRGLIDSKGHKVHGGNLKTSKIFYRQHGTKTIQEADDILEEDLAAVITAAESMGGNTNVSITDFLVGGSSATTRSIANLADDQAKEILQKLAEHENKKVSTRIGKATGKVDISGNNITLSYSKELPFVIERFLMLMKDAAISAKNYKSTSWAGGQMSIKDLAEINLQLGHTNLYKAITGALSEVKLGHRQQHDIFYRGINTIINNSHGYGNITQLHFNHLRFIYELRGSGLLGSDGLVMPVKYLIYNDPDSDAIFVKDTASIILEILESSTRINSLLGEVTLSAYKVQS